MSRSDQVQLQGRVTERLTTGEDGNSADPPGKRMGVGLGLALGLGLEAALEKADSCTSGLSCIAAPRGLSCTTAPSPRSMLAKETGESGSCRRPVAARTLHQACWCKAHIFIVIFS